jgi:hypothetical protein
MRRLIPTALSLMLSVASISVAPARLTVAAAQQQEVSPPQVSQAIYHGRSRPLRDIPAMAPNVPRRAGEPRPTPGGPTQQVQDPVTQTFAAVALPASIDSGFEGIGEGAPQAGYNVVYAPSDINGAIGPDHYVQWVNVVFAVFDRNGVKLAGPTAGNTLWAATAPNSNCGKANDGDPIVQYDKAANRWVMTQFQVSYLPYSQCVAISDDGNPAGNWHLYEFTYSGFPDYPKLAVWHDAYYISFNLFSATTGGFIGGLACAYERDKMLTGATARQVCFQGSGTLPSLLPSDLDGTAAPPSGRPNFFINFTTNALRLYKFHVDWTNTAASTFSAATTIAVAPFTRSCNGSGGTCVPQPGTNQKLDTLGDRLMYRLAYRNFGSHESLVVNHSVQASNGVTGIRWYEIRNPNGTPTVHQQGTYAPDTTHRWMGSAAMDKFGNIAIGYSASSSSVYPSVRFTGWQVGDPLGQLGMETTAKGGTGSQTRTLSRWGDYSSIFVDPVDDCTFWYTNQFLKVDGTWNWTTWISSFRFDACGGTTPVADFSLGATPSSSTVTAGGGTSFTVSSTATDGFTSDVGLTVDGLPAGGSASFSPSSTITGGDGSATLNVTTTASTPGGSYPLTITGTGGGKTHTATVTLVVNAPASADFALGVSPGNRNVRAGDPAVYSVTITPSGGFSSSVTLSLAGVPNYTFSPNPATGSSTLTVQTAGLARGSYSLTITGVGGGKTHTATVNLRVR